MKRGPQVATAVAVGYALGRSRKMKLALMVGGVVLGRRMGNPKELLAKAGGAVAGSSEVSELSNVLRDRLVDAAKTAAVAAASNKLDSLGDNLSERAAKIRSPQSDSSESEVEGQQESTSSEQEQESTSSERDPDSSEQGTRPQKGKKAPAQRSSSDDDQPAEQGKRTRAPRKPSAPRAPSTTSRKKAAPSSGGSRRKSGGNDG